MHKVTKIGQEKTEKIAHHIIKLIKSNWYLEHDNKFNVLKTNVSVLYSASW